MTSLSKLGPHNLKPTADAKRMVGAGCRIIKLVDDFGSAAEYLAINPNILIIGRRISVYVDQDGRVITGENLRQAHEDTPEIAARFFVDVQRGTYNLNPLVKIWEGVNEPSWEVKENGIVNVQKTVANYNWYSRFEVERIRLLRDIGLIAVIGNFSTGTPDIGDGNTYAWDAFLPALVSANINGAYLGLHEYSDGKLNKDVDPTTGEGWHTFRYRRVRRLILAPNGLADLPIILTEYGVDFKRPSLSIDYVSELKWADGELRKDSDVEGACIFTYGSTSSAWTNFNLEGTQEARDLTAYVASIPDTNPPDDPPPPPEEPPMTAVDFSTISYEKTYKHVAPAGQPSAGDNVNVAVGMKLAYVDDTTVRVKFPVIKSGAPNFGEIRTSDQAIARPEIVFLYQAEMSDIPYPVVSGIPTKRLKKAFHGDAPIWMINYMSINTLVGAKYRLTWPVRPELVMDYDKLNGNKKIYADDPAAYWARFRSASGEVDFVVDPNPVMDETWYNGNDLPFGFFTRLQFVFDATTPVTTVGFETCLPFGLKDNDEMSGPPELELLSSDGEPNPGETDPPVTGTLRSLALKLKEAVAAIDSVGDIADAIVALIG